MKSETHLRALLVVAAAAVAVGVGCSGNSDHDPEAVSDTAEAVTTEGNWSGFTGGQCVHGVYQFYLHRFGIDLTGTCVQTGDIGRCENCGACMIWESSKVRPDSSLFNRHAWGSVMPQTYDIVVYPPLSGTGPGHVAAVDHLASSDKSDWKKLYVMDSNYVGYEEKAPQVHTVDRAPYGFYRLKSREPKPTSVSPSGNYAFSDNGTVSGFHCVNVDEPADHTASFANDYFCSKKDLGMKWSHSGTIAGMTCTKVNEPKETGTWTDNYLCLPHASSVSFDWSYAGKISGEDCTAWREGDATSFGDNYLCTK